MPFFLGFPGGSAGKDSAWHEGDLGLMSGLGRSLGEGNSCILQYSGLENSMDCVVCGIIKSWTRLSDFHFHGLYFVYFLSNLYYNNYFLLLLLVFLLFLICFNGRLGYLRFFLFLEVCCSAVNFLLRSVFVEYHV